MLLRYIQIISIIMIIVFFYKKTKEKMFLWILSYALFLGVCLELFRTVFPKIVLGSATLEYGMFLLVVGVPFLVLVVVIGVQIEKRSKNRVENGALNIASVFSMQKDNIVFWGTIIIINLVVLLFDK